VHDHRVVVKQYLGGDENLRGAVVACSGCYAVCRSIPCIITMALREGEPEEGFFLVNEALQSVWRPSIAALLAQSPAPVVHGSVLWCPADAKIILVGIWPEFAHRIIDVDIRVLNPHLKRSLGRERITVVCLKVEPNGKVEIPLGTTNEWTTAYLVGRSEKGAISFTAHPHE